MALGVSPDIAINHDAVAKYRRS